MFQQNRWLWIETIILCFYALDFLLQQGIVSMEFLPGLQFYDIMGFLGFASFFQELGTNTAGSQDLA